GLDARFGDQLADRGHDAACDVAAGRFLHLGAELRSIHQDGIGVRPADVDADSHKRASIGVKFRSYPNALGPTTASASGVRSIGEHGTPITATRYPYRSCSVVIGSPSSRFTTQMRSGTDALTASPTHATRFSFWKAILISTPR